MDSDSDHRPEYFSVYKADGETQDLAAFSLHNEYHVRGLDTLWQAALDLNLAPGTHSFYIDATNDDGTSGPSNIVSISVLDTVSLFFTDYPKAESNEISATTLINTPFMYQIGATTWSGSTVRYNLAPLFNELPSGLEIDESTGVISWTPTVKGMYRFKVQATMPDYPGIVVEAPASILVRECSVPAVIAGTITDQHGNPAAGVVSLYSVAPADTSRWTPIATESTTTGSFSLSVDAGSYILLFDGKECDAEFYEDTRLAEEATVITVECGDVESISMTVNHVDFYTVSGRVANQDGEPLGYAQVQVMGVDPSLPPDERIRRPLYYWCVTNSEGEYSTQVRGGYIYTATASYTVQGNGLATTYVQFFDHADNVAEAEQMLINADRTGVDFDLDLGSKYDNSISGRVSTTLGSAVDAYVSVWKVGGGMQSNTATRTSNGEYALGNLTPGDYIIYVVPNNYSLSPGYYHESGFAVLSWDEATRITVSEDSELTGLNIAIAVVDTGAFGGGGLSGKVRGGSGAIDKGDGKVQNADIIVGAFVTLTSQSGVVTRYNFSDASGNFSLSTLPAGTYTLVIDKPGYKPYKSTVEVGDSKQDFDVVLETEVVTGVDEVEQATAMRVYPNPAVNNTLLSFSATRGMARISVVTATGAEVFSVQQPTVDGDNTLLLDTRTLSSGSYFVRINAGGLLRTCPLHIVR